MTPVLYSRIASSASCDCSWASTRALLSSSLARCLGLERIAGLGLFPADRQGGQGGDGGDHDQRGGGGPGRGAMPARPSGQATTPAIGQRGHRLVGHPSLDVIGQGARRGVAIVGLGRHGLEADRLERLVDPGIKLAGRRELAADARHGGRGEIIALGRRLAGEQAVEGRAQAVDIRRAARAGRSRRGPARDSYRRACPWPSRAGSRRCRRPTSASWSARRPTGRPCRSPWPGPSRRPASRHACRG